MAQNLIGRVPMLAPESFATSMDWMMERTVGQGMNGVSFGQSVSK